MSEKNFIDKYELANYLKCHPITVQKYAIRGILPAYKINKQWQFDKKEINEWLITKKIKNNT